MLIAVSKNRSARRARGASRHDAAAAGIRAVRLPWRQLRSAALVLLLIAVLLLVQQAVRAVQAVPVGDVLLLGVDETSSASPGSSSIGRDEVLALAGEQLQLGFWQLDLQTLKQAIEQHQWVRQAVVSRRWPNHLVIGIDQQLPVARWNTSQLLASSGVLIDVGNNASFAQLPQFTIQREAASRLQLEQLAKQFNQMQAPLLQRGLQILRFGQAGSGDTWLQVDGDELAEPLRIELGIANTAARLQRFLAFYDRQVGIDRMQLARVDLRYPNGLSVAWHRASGNLDLALADHYE